MTDTHSCSYFCDRPACIKAQRDELRDALAQKAEPQPLPTNSVASQKAANLNDKAAPPAPAVPLTDAQIERLREATFSTNNPYCPVDSKSMRKAVRAAERAHGIAAAGENP